MTAPEFAAGDVVDIHIRRALVDAVYGNGEVWVFLGEAGRWRVDHRSPGWTVTRIAPANWPPRANDVWSDGDEDDLPGSPCEWHVLPRRLGSDELVLHLDSSSPGMAPADFVAQYPSARLVRRREPKTADREAGRG